MKRPDPIAFLKPPRQRPPRPPKDDNPPCDCPDDPLQTPPSGSDAMVQGAVAGLLTLLSPDGIVRPVKSKDGGLPVRVQTNSSWPVHVAIVSDATSTAFAEVTRTATQAISSSSLTALQWDTIVRNDGTMFSTGANTLITASQARDFDVVVYAPFAASTAGGTYMRLELYQNSSLIAADQIVPSSAVLNYLQVQRPVRMAQNDTLSAKVKQDSGTTVNISVSELAPTFIVVSR